MIYNERLRIRWDRTVEMRMSYNNDGIFRAIRWSFELFFPNKSAANTCDHDTFAHAKQMHRDLCNEKQPHMSTITDGYLLSLLLKIRSKDV